MGYLGTICRREETLSLCYHTYPALVLPGTRLSTDPESVDGQLS